MISFWEKYVFYVTCLSVLLTLEDSLSEFLSVSHVYSTKCGVLAVKIMKLLRL